MKELYFEKLENIGDLYLERVFNEFEGENIIFICSDINLNKYFCVCYEMRYKLEWAICKIDTASVCCLLKNKIDLHTIFEKSVEGIIQVVFENDKTTLHSYSYEQFDKSLLPDKGVYLKPDEDQSGYLLRLLYDKNNDKKSSIKCSDKYFPVWLDNYVVESESFNWNINISDNKENTGSECTYSAIAA